MIRGILFDKDGTLVDFDRTWMPAYRRASAVVVERFPGPVSATGLLEVAGYDAASGRCDPTAPLGCGSNLDIARVWADCLPPADPRAVRDAIEAVFNSSVVPAPVAELRDLQGLFRALRARGLRLGVATMDSEFLARDTIARFGLAEEVGFVAGYDSGYGEKPGPGMVHAFCAHAALDPASVAVVGDTLHDLEMGRAAGAGRVLGVLSGAGSAELLGPHADALLDDITDLLEREVGGSAHGFVGTLP